MHTGANQLPISPPQTAQSPILLANHNIGLLPQQPLHPPRLLPPRPLSAGPITSASQLPESMTPGFPAPEVNHVALLPFPADMTHTVDPTHQYTQYHTPPPLAQQQQQLPLTPLELAAMGYEPEEGKGERALRVTRHLRLSSRHRSVSPTSHRYPQPPVQEEEQLINHHNLGVPAVHAMTRTLPVPPVVLSPGLPGVAMLPLISSPDPTTTVLHSPRPQLTPKHSLANITDAYNKTTTVTKSEYVEELEKMADVVVRRSGNDLSGDLSKVVVEEMEEELRGQDGDAKEVVVPASLKRNKTLPGPPPPPPTLNGMVHETEPLPSDQTPPTPTLHALAMRPRGRDKDKRELLQELRTENGLDALERRLLREVGTRKPNANPRPDVRGMLGRMPEPVKESELDAVTREADARRKGIESGDRSKPIPIPVKSPEPLNNDSAISSLTLAGRMLEDMDDDQDSDGGKTHRAGSWSSVGRDNGRGRSRQSQDVPFDEDLGRLPVHRHTRERAEVIVNGRTPTKTEEDDNDKAQISLTKEKPGVQRKKVTKAKAKGRVAAWLGGIDVGVPPQEQIIPPSPSVVRCPAEISGLLGDDDDEKGDNEEEEKGHEMKAGTTAPNPRSSGFVPIGSTVNATTALNRNTIHFNLGMGPSSTPLVTLRDATVVEEARRVQALWDGGGDLSSLGYAPAQERMRDETTKTPKQAEVAPAMTSGVGIFNKFPISFPPLARAQSIRTNRKVSPPSNAVKERNGIHRQKNDLVRPTPIPMSYSAAAKNAWNGGLAAGVAPLKNITLPSLSAKPTTNAERLTSFPPPSNAHPNLDTDAKYDIRSVRGGRGGKVTAVANLWASGAIMNQGASSASSGAPVSKRRVLTGMGNVDNQISKPAVARPDLDTKSAAFIVPTKTEKKTFSAALMTPAPPPPPASSKPAIPAVSGSSNARKPPLPPKQFVEDQRRPGASKVFTKPSPPSRALAKRPATAVSTHKLGSDSQSPQLSQGGHNTPMPMLRTSLSTPPSPDRRKPDMSLYPISTGPKTTPGAGGGLKPKPGMIIPPSTNPASVVLSSSHAVPHLSSTASLARPHVLGNVPPKVITTVGPPSSSSNRATAPRTFPAMLSTSKSAPSSILEGGRIGSPSKLPDLSFGQARLRDLIKKYQGQGA